MLANYDAEAVADVMGIAFLEGPGRALPAGAGRAKAETGARPSAAATTGTFVITVDRDPVQIVEVLAGGLFGTFEKPDHGVRRNVTARNSRTWPPSPVLIEKAVENGLPRLVLRHVAEQIAGADRTKIASLEWGIVPRSTLERREGQLSPLESERTERVARLFVHARRALGSAAEARAFLTTPHPQLDARTPIDAARTDLGTRRAEQILNALEYGLAV